MICNFQSDNRTRNNYTADINTTATVDDKSPHPHYDIPIIDFDDLYYNGR